MTRVTNGLTLFNKIKNFRIKDIDLIFAVGKSLYKVAFKNAAAANNFVLNDKIKSIGLRAFVPKTAVETYGVVRGITTWCEIKADAISSVPITAVRRFTRRNQENESFTPTTTVKIGFLGKEIPEFIIFNHTKLYVDFYVPPLRQCLNCGRLGHTQFACKSKKRCIKCGLVTCDDNSCNKK